MSDEQLLQQTLQRAKQLGVLLYIKDGRLGYQVKKGGLPAELKADIVRLKDSIIAHLQQNAERKTQTALPPITKADREAELPLSFAQQRLWFIDQLGGSSTQYNVPGTIKLPLDLNQAALEKAIEAMLQRHEILRCRYELVLGEAKLAISQRFDLPLAVVDLSKLEVEEAQRQVKQTVEQQLNTAFDLSQDLMLRCHLFKLPAGQHLLFYMLHHIACDGWSRAIFESELSRLYISFAKGQPNPLPELKVQYADFALWQRNYLQGETLDKQLDYWLEHLSGINPLHQLPIDKSRPAQQTFKGARISHHLDAERYQQIKRLAEQHQVTVFMFLQTAFAVLLGRYSASKDIVMGSPISGRTHGDIEGLIGFFINTLVLRTDLGGRPTFSQLLARNKKTLLAAFGHQQIPFEMLVDKLSPERNLSHNPLTQISFMLQQANERAQATNDTAKAVAQTVAQTAEGMATDVNIKNDLELACSENTSGELSVSWFYNLSLFEAPSIERMAQSFNVLLDDIVHSMRSSHDKTIDQLNLLETQSAAKPDAAKPNAAKPNAKVQQTAFASLHQLFESTAAQYPDARALVYGEEQLDYAQLNQKANQLAHQLIALGINQNSKVGLYVERGIDMVVGLLGILKAGAGYIPLDPDFPHNRLSYIVKDSGLNCVVSNLPERLTTLFGQSQYIEVVSLGEAQRSYPQHNPDVSLHRANRAYVIYTSGSTGKPKGVDVSHHSAVNFLTSMAKKPGLANTDKLLAVTTLSFDIALLEWLGPLTVGACIAIADRALATDGQALMDYIEQQDITVMQATPVTWKLLLDNGWQGKKSFKALVGGEAFKEELAATLTDKVDSLWNLYGPTETTVWSAVHQLAPGHSGKVALGEPIDNSEIYILDEYNQQVPTGVIGEACIGGDGLALGYLAKGGLTAKQFIPDAFSGKPGSRLYRTGDLMRFNNDGLLEYIGRVDHQVKLNGYRIELGEIEQVLLRHEQVKEAVVVVAESDQQQYLMAYVVETDEAGDDISEQLRSNCLDELPTYMVPHRFVSLEQLPLTVNGKIDIKALLLMSVDNGQNAEFIALETQTQQKLVTLWAQVLDKDEHSIGQQDSFFSLGGHSLLAIKLVSLINEAFAAGVVLTDIFRLHRMAELAALIDQRASGDWLDSLRITALGVDASAELEDDIEEFDL